MFEAISGYCVRRGTWEACLGGVKSGEQGLQESGLETVVVLGLGKGSEGSRQVWRSLSKCDGWTWDELDREGSKNQRDFQLAFSNWMMAPTEERCGWRRQASMATPVKQGDPWSSVEMLWLPR